MMPWRRAISKTPKPKVERQIAHIVEAIKEGLYVPAMKGELLVLEERQAELLAETAEAKDEMPRLHPGLAEVYRQKVADLTAALNQDELRTEATETLRSLIEEIKLIPQDGQLMIELVGALAGILALGQNKRPQGGTWGWYPTHDGKNASVREGRIDLDRVAAILGIQGETVRAELWKEVGLAVGFYYFEAYDSPPPL